MPPDVEYDDAGSDWDNEPISLYFYSSKNQEKFDNIRNNAMDSKKVINENSFEEHNLIAFLKSRKLYIVVT